MKVLSFSVWLVSSLALLATQASAQSPPAIQSFQHPTRELTWTNGSAEGLILIERSLTLEPDSWIPFFFDLATPTSRTVRLPDSGLATEFYRITLQTNIPDPSLVLHIPFDNALASGQALDISGHGNHGLRFSLTNWPAAAPGPDDSQSAQFRRHHSVSGDYVAVPYATELDDLTNGTVLAWARFTTNSYGASAIVDGAWWQSTNSWVLGREYTLDTRFSVYRADGSRANLVTYPDLTVNGVFDTGGWHYYGATWDGTRVVGFFDGLPISTNSMAGIPKLAVGGRYRWIGIGCRNHDGTPDWGDDLYPNNGWMGGGIDDVRIYNRALASEEILDLYNSFDHQPPLRPLNLMASPTSSSQIRLTWSPSPDNFRVAGFIIRRDGDIIADTAGWTYYDTGLGADQTFAYTVQAHDEAGNLSPESAPAVASTGTDGSGVDFILDNADGAPWIHVRGTWVEGSGLPDFWGAGYLDDKNQNENSSLTFRPWLPEGGDYDVYMWYPGSRDFWWLVASDAPVDVVHAGQTNQVLLNQQTNYGQWSLLGRFFFEPGTNGFVRLRTDGASANRVVGDAVRFVK